MIPKIYSILFTVIAVTFLQSVPFAVFAQDSARSLMLNDAITAAINNNKTIQLAKLDENIATANYKQTEAVFLPQVNFSYTAMNTNNPLNAFGFKLQQGSITQNDFNPALLNHPSGTSDFMTKLEVQQPLLNMDMLYMRKGAEKQTEVYQYKTRRTTEYLTFEVQKAYLQLQLAYDAAKVLDESLQTVKSVYTFTDNHFKQGLIQKSDLLNARVQVTTVESNLAKAQSNIRNASDYLSLLMGQKTGIVYKINEILPATRFTADTSQRVVSSRADFMAMQKAIDASNLMIKSSQLSYLPKLNAFGNYQYNDDHLTGFGANAYLIGLQLSWDIFKGNKTKNTIAVQRLERDKLTAQLAQQKDQSQLEISKAFRDLADARFEIGQDKAAIEQASESLRILQNRYQQGLVNTTDVLLAGTQLSQQKFALAQAQFTLNVTAAYLQLLTTTTNK
ncbi:MAG: TolC family protein [Sphingobacteriales bacterium]